MPEMRIHHKGNKNVLDLYNDLTHIISRGYVILHGAQLYPTFPKESSKAFRFISLILKCTGGGTLVPVFINAIPVNMGVDSCTLLVVL